MPISSGNMPPGIRPRFFEQLAHWQAHQPEIRQDAAPASMLVLRQFQQEARATDAGAFDLAVLDAVAGLFEFILDDPDVSRRYKADIAQLQVPILRVALASQDFFSDAQHPARQTLDLLGVFSRRFPEHTPHYSLALNQVEAACSLILDDPDHQGEAFVRAHGVLAAWLADENARKTVELTSEMAYLEQIEQQELGTLLALDNLNDLTERYHAPESVLRRLEAAWVPHMASLYMEEAGEGPNWRAACTAMLQLFLSLQPPNEAEREARLQSIPLINDALRRGLLAQGADPAHLKDFFTAITTTQSAWIRPDSGQQEAMLSTFVPLHAGRADIESLAQEPAAAPADDSILQQTQQLLEGDWVDFDPPFEGLVTARVAWVGVRGYLLFCDSEGGQRFSIDCEQLADEIRTGRAHIPEQSLTRKAMLRLKSHFLGSPG